MKKATTYLIIAVALSTTTLVSCNQETIPEKPALELVFDRGDILDLAVAEDVVCFTREGNQLVIFDRIDSTFSFKSEFNSGVSRITNIDKLNRDQVLVGIGSFGIYAYSSAHEYARYGDVGDLSFFNASRQLCVAQPGILKYRNEWGNYYRIPKVIPTSVTGNISCMLAQDNTIWAGTASEGVLKFDPQGFQDSITSFQGHLADDSTRKMIFDENDDLWVLTQKGLSTMRNDKWTVYENPDGVLSNDMTTLDNEIYVATNLGVYRFSGDSLVPYDALNQHLANRFINVIEPDERNRFWLGTQKGIFVFQP